MPRTNLIRIPAVAKLLNLTVASTYTLAHRDPAFPKPSEYIGPTQFFNAATVRRYAKTRRGRR